MKIRNPRLELWDSYILLLCTGRHSRLIETHSRLIREFATVRVGQFTHRAIMTQHTTWYVHTYAHMWTVLGSLFCFHQLDSNRSRGMDGPIDGRR